MYCVNENKDAKAHFAFFFNFSFCHSYIYGHFSSKFSQKILDFIFLVDLGHISVEKSIY